MYPQSTMNPNSKFQSDLVKFWFENDVLFASFPENSKISLPRAKEIVAQRIEFTQGETYKAVVDITNIKSVSFEARTYWASIEGYSSIDVLAIYSPSALSKVLSNFWLKVNKPFKPTKFFTDKVSALEYLKSAHSPY